ncbi:MAG: alpha-ribazole phosphatase family protein [Rhodocyclaceae bacterium]|nr:alpha-ribazole phosphatase family protein [Rhodocyclaceae bacterium]
MDLFLIRHPRPDVAPGTCYGVSDVGLAEPVGPVAARLRPLLPSGTVVYSSPLGRALRLAEALGAPRLDPRLREIDFGSWELQPFDDLRGALDAWAADPLGFRAPGGESAREMALRVDAALDDILAAHPDGAVAVVAHGGPLRAIAGRLLGLPQERWLGLDFAFGAMTHLHVASWGTVLKAFNRAAVS